MADNIEALRIELQEKEMRILDLQNKIVRLSFQHTDLKRSKLSIKDVIKVNGDNSTNEILQITNVHQTPNGVIVEVK